MQLQRFDVNWTSYELNENKENAILRYGPTLPPIMVIEALQLLNKFNWLRTESFAKKVAVDLFTETTMQESYYWASLDFHLFKVEPIIKDLEEQYGISSKK